MNTNCRVLNFGEDGMIDFSNEETNCDDVSSHCDYFSSFNSESIDVLSKVGSVDEDDDDYFSCHTSKKEKERLRKQKQRDKLKVNSFGTPVPVKSGTLKAKAVATTRWRSKRPVDVVELTNEREKKRLAESRILETPTKRDARLEYQVSYQQAKLSSMSFEENDERLPKQKKRDREKIVFETRQDYINRTSKYREAKKLRSEKSQGRWQNMCCELDKNDDGKPKHPASLTDEIFPSKFQLLNYESNPVSAVYMFWNQSGMSLDCNFSKDRMGEYI